MQRSEYDEIVSKLKTLHVAVKYSASLADVAELTVDGEQAIMPVACKSLCSIGCRATDRLVMWLPSLGIQERLHSPLSGCL
jgi:hypothetical protein